MNTKLADLIGIGQSIWLDFIRRSFILDGDLARLANLGVRGVTSNPAIFEKAIAHSRDYEAQLLDLCSGGDVEPEMIYEALALKDIAMAADTLRTVYEATDGLDGYVSLEVSPDLAYDTERTVAEARRLFAAIGRPNVLIKIPATAEGIPAIRTLIGEGINVNVTLMFSLAQYDAVAEAYIAGLEAFAAAGGDLRRVASVASFFVSRVDVMVDRLLADIGTPRALSLQGKTAVANAKLAYQRFKKAFQGPRWASLAARGARVQRVLWASTSTKNPAYSDTLYVDSLIGPDTVNTLPPQTLEAFLDHGIVAATIEQGVDEAEVHMEMLREVGIDLDAVTDQLLIEGVEKFVQPFAALMGSIEAKCRELIPSRVHMSLPETMAERVVEGLKEVAQQRVTRRIWAYDYTVWSDEPTEVVDRLGWLDEPAVRRRHVDGLEQFVDEVRADGYTEVLLLGMGGSSLAPEVFSRVFGSCNGYPRLAVLDSTDPGAVLSHARRLDLAHTLFIVSSKSGTTAETLSFFKYFYNQVQEHVGGDNVGAHFVAITDPGTPLAHQGRALGFRRVFINNPTLGGRYSALSLFGLVPAALLGLDVARLLDRALVLAYRCPDCRADTRSATELGVTMGELAKTGRDKLTLVMPSSLEPFGDWVEQLVAESTGKDGKGILPVTGEPLAAPEVYGSDRLFVALDWAKRTIAPEALAALQSAGHPVLHLTLDDVYDLGTQIFLWELAVAIAGARLGIQPFNQPNVEAAKVLARQMIASYQKTGSLPAYPYVPARSDVLHEFLSQARAGDYIAIQAYLMPTDETTAALQQLRLALRSRYRLATTIGYGPRYLHSTGQLHKGDGGHGLFIQFTADPAEDVAIPDQPGVAASSLTFGVLAKAQAMGDYEALKAAGRRVVHMHLEGDVVQTLRRLAQT